MAKASTASVGKFQEKLPKEKKARGLGVKELIPGIKRKASHVGNGDEKTANLELINSVLSKKPKYDVDKAITVQKREAREEWVFWFFDPRQCNCSDAFDWFCRREANPEETRKGKKSKKGGSKYQAANSKKPKAGAGQRNPKKKFGGRKRR